MSPSVGVQLLVTHPLKRKRGVRVCVCVCVCASTHLRECMTVYLCTGRQRKIATDSVFILLFVLPPKNVNDYSPTETLGGPISVNLPETSSRYTLLKFSHDETHDGITTSCSCILPDPNVSATPPCSPFFRNWNCYTPTL